ASRAITRCPHRASNEAATLPAGPAPMTKTSASIKSSFEGPARSVPLDKIRRESTESESKHTAYNQAPGEQLQKEIEYPLCLGCAAHALQGYRQPVAVEQDRAHLRIGKKQQRRDRGG